MVPYRIGIDVGLNSVGFAAIEVSPSGSPERILNMQSVIHDSGVEEAKTAKTRKAVSGGARRMRRLIRRRRARLTDLDKSLIELGWPIVDLETISDPYYPWRVREELVTAPIRESEELYRKLSIALRHIARHRGWRNPYTKVQTLLAATGPSKEFLTFIESVKKRSGMERVDPESTVAEIVCAALETDLTQRIRGTRKDVVP
ncbi:MAG: hypothetical protein LBK28_01825, partial [Propionibacteriaceae bacterium]|nr:hypothetical protein [Propionibacteriaceae bacterium]